MKAITAPVSADEAQKMWDGQWLALQERLAHVSRLIRDFHELHDAKIVKERKDLQLQVQLYRQECVRIHAQFIRLLTQKPAAQKA